MQLKKQIPVTVVMLGLVSFFTDAATEMIYPLIPIYVAALGSGAIVLGMIEGFAETTAALLKLVSGVISDKIGKRKGLVLIGYALSSLARPLTGMVSSAWQIILIRMTDRVGKGIRTAPRDALIASAVDEGIRGKAYGFHRAMDHAGAVAGPMLAIATLLIVFGFFEIHDTLTALRWTFYLALIPGILAVLTIIFFVKESADQGKSKSAGSFSLKQFDRNFIRYMVVILFFTLGNSSDAFLLFRVEEAVKHSGAMTEMLRHSAMLQGLLGRFGDVKLQTDIANLLLLPLIWAFFHVIKVVFSTPLGALSDRIGRKVVIISGWAIYALVYFAFALLLLLPAHWQMPATLLLFAVYALYYAFTEGTEKAFVADLVGPDQRGSAFGLYNFSVGLGALPASILFGVLYSFFEKAYPGWGGAAAFGLGGFLAVLAMVMLAFFVNEPRKDTEAARRG